MPQFHYKAKESTGGIVEATIEAVDKFTLAKDLKTEGKEVISVEEVQKKGMNIDVSKYLTRIKMQDRIVFAKNLSAMIDAGLALSRALAVLEKQTQNVSSKRYFTTSARRSAKGIV